MKHNHEWIGTYIWICKCGKIALGNPYWKRKRGRPKKSLSGEELEHMKLLYNSCK